MKTQDYSDRAIEQRIVRLSQLRKLCLSLAKANPKLARKQPDEKSSASDDLADEFRTQNAE